jgi:hypothetical protein
VLTGNFGTYGVQVTGELGAYCDDDEMLDISSEWQLTVEYESHIVILGENVLGCTDPDAPNYDPDASFNDGSCQADVSIDEIIHNCGDDMGQSLECNGKYDLSSASASACPLYETQITTTGIVVDYYDVTPSNGPYSFTIQDADGNQMDFVVWPESSFYQDGFDITATDLNVLTGNFGTYEVQVTGELGAYCDDDEMLDISSEWQLTVEYESHIVILGENDLGCTDPEAPNYDPDASIDDGSCLSEPVFGCTDMNACNYNADATEDDGNCLENDCAGECGGIATTDICGVCNGVNIYPYECEVADSSNITMNLVIFPSGVFSLLDWENGEIKLAELTILNSGDSTINYYLYYYGYLNGEKVVDGLTKKTFVASGDSTIMSNTNFDPYFISEYYENWSFIYNLESLGYLSSGNYIVGVAAYDSETDVLLANVNAGHILGCTDPGASNYEQSSTMDDGTCYCDGNVDLGCGCGEAGPSGCDGLCGSTLENDECGVCGGAT